MRGHAREVETKEKEQVVGGAKDLDRFLSDKKQLDEPWQLVIPD
jgi:hypothetical protein